MRRFLVLCLGLAVGAAPAAAAQAGGSIDLGVFGRVVNYDKSLNDKTGLGAGGRLGVYLANGWAIAGDLSSNSTKNKTTSASATTTPIHVRLEKHLGAAGRWIIGVGYAHEKVSLVPPGAPGTADGFSGAIGYQHQFNHVTGLRIDGVADYYSTGANAIPSAATKPTNINFSLQVGLNFLLAAHHAPKDSDHDGVPDTADLCPGTPAGTAVDAHGCPLPKDSDHDGVTDDKDMCPNTPFGVKVDAKGCPLPVDSDHDGVPDSLDKCPGTPAGQKVDAQGCPIPIDSDGDGVPDNLDKCPGTPVGQKVDANGCPLPIDSDHDGVPDNLDKCPGTPLGQKVDANGCPILFEAGKSNITLQGVTFLTGRSVLTPNAKIILDGVAGSLKGNPTVKVEVGGYTDNAGSRLRNVNLSRARANTVRGYLISKGVAPTQLTARGYGPANPVASNTTADGRAQNRRVELKKLP